jgi:4-diphosphocytidyl-2-C-methyl-D-erythritol kinase
MALAGIHDRFVLVRAPAKINLYLELNGRRSDGYHELETVMVAVSLFDTVRLRELPCDQLELRCLCSPEVGRQDDRIPSDSSNLAWKALDRLRRSVPNPRPLRGGRLDLFKRIPTQAGLGGGSSDAAAALVAARRIWNLEISDAELAEIGAGVGSDVPFFVDPGMAVCRGRGEIVRPLNRSSPLWFVVVKPPIGLSARRVYDHGEIPAKPRSGQAIRDAIERQSPRAIGRLLFNRLQSAAEQLVPEIQIASREFSRLDCCGHQMTGSGTAYFGLFAHRDLAVRAANQLRARMPDWFIGRCRSIPRGFASPIEESPLQEAADEHY